MTLQDFTTMFYVAAVLASILSVVELSRENGGAVLPVIGLSMGAVAILHTFSRVVLTIVWGELATVGLAWGLTPIMAVFIYKSIRNLS